MINSRMGEHNNYVIESKMEDKRIAVQIFCRIPFENGGSEYCSHNKLNIIIEIWINKYVNTTVENTVVLSDFKMSAL